MKTRASKSNLHLQIGQETIYLIMATSVIAAIYFAMRLMSLSSVARMEAPIITLNEADGYEFRTGSAEVSGTFTKLLIEKVVPKVETSGEFADARIVEVVGHTDEVPLKSAKRHEANLDATLPTMLNGQIGLEARPADNVGLGMARAVAVSAVLRKSRLGSRFTIIPMSAGPFLKPDDTAASGTAFVNDPSRRRIEIRLRRSVGRTRAG